MYAFQKFNCKQNEKEEFNMLLREINWNGTRTKNGIVQTIIGFKTY